ncbi:hypothetical protein [Kribbella sp. VKM Ac-2568]|uniref:hypothetical protein n=1 Tax=Kribbella sp. VKM Ac-2568 TaxID=2512219 RepID=UPI0010EADFC6|nr:hypothetical protein [Kribbella sp. VKM Ac-2568]TCM45605.1 hypothetical protein EV648_10666 [Kribbella sp. VKM Ac-2568]
MTDIKYLVPDVFLLKADGQRVPPPDLPYCVTAGQAYPTRDGLLVLGGDKDLARWNHIQHQTALRDAAPKGSPTWNHH